MRIAMLMIVSGLILSTTLAGCERWMQVAERPSRGAVAVGPSIASDHKSPAVLGTIRITQNGAQQNPDLEFERRVATPSRVIATRTACTAPCAREAVTANAWSTGTNVSPFKLRWMRSMTDSGKCDRLPRVSLRTRRPSR